MFTRRTKIVCTIGPSSNSPEAIESLIEAGMDVARLNFSHGTHDDHQRAVDAIRDASARYRKAITILGDLSGPKIRAGRIGGAREVVAGDTLCLMAGEDAPPGVPESSGNRGGPAAVIQCPRGRHRPHPG